MESRAHVFAVAAQVMRHIPVDHARAKHCGKRGGAAVRVPLDETTMITIDEQDIDLIALDEALNRFAKVDEQQVRIVELRYFGGLTLEAAAEALRISRATAARDWNVAKAWLHRELLPALSPRLIPGSDPEGSGFHSVHGPDEDALGGLPARVRMTRYLASKSATVIFPVVAFGLAGNIRFPPKLESLARSMNSQG